MGEMRRTRLIAAGGLLLALLALAGCGNTKANQPPKGGSPEVVVAVMKEERVPITIELPGRTSAYLIAEVRPQVNGVIQKRFFTEGDDVKTGDILYQIDPAPYQAAYDNTRATLAKVEANVPPVRLRAERYKELVAIKAVSQQDYDEASAALKQVEAEVGVSKAAVEAARINLAYTKIIAPITGRIGKSHITVGALTTAHQVIPLTTIQQLDPIYVDATQSSANLLAVKRKREAGAIKGDSARQAKVRLLLEDGTPYPSEGTLKFSDVTVDPTTGSFTLRMVFPNPKHTLLPGMYVRPVIEEGVVERGILAPQQGVARDPKGNPYALVVNGEGKVEQRTLTLDRAMGDKWLISEGLAAGDRVIIEGLQKVRPGSPVKIVSSTGAANPGQGAGKQDRPAAKAN